MSKIMIECADVVVKHMEGLERDGKLLDTKE